MAQNNKIFSKIVEITRRLHCRPDGFLPLHAPVFSGNESKYVNDCIETTFVSSVGSYVGRFEELLQSICGVRFAVACTNGTSALEMALRVVGVGANDLVLTQALSFVATANAITHCGAEPVFLDVERTTMGLSADELERFLCEDCSSTSIGIRHKYTGKRIAACVPVHTFGHPCRIEEIVEICTAHHIPVVEDAAESLGSFYNKKHTGGFGTCGILSFNGNKICTTGGGGALLTDDESLARRAKHLTTTAKRPHSWEFYHEEVAWNYRLTNLAAALGCAQLERLNEFVMDKRKLADEYADSLSDSGFFFIKEPAHCQSNYWLNAVLTNGRSERDAFLAFTNAEGVMTRPVWQPLCDLPMYANCIVGLLPNTRFFESCLVNIPSSFRDFSKQ